jgi:hypothetical protein
MSKISFLVKFHILVLMALIGLALYVSPISFFAQDGYLIFAPILTEFFKGDGIYSNSKVFFGGQNLLALYGYLPFWKIFRWLNFDFIKSLNLSLWIFWLLLYYFSFSIYTYFRKTFQLIDFYLLSFYVFTSPIIFNRLYSGHINLLFGLLPSFAFLQILIQPKWHSYLLGIFCLWFAFNFQGHQMIAYIPFYLPLYLIFFLDLEKKAKVKALGASFCITFLGLALAYPTFRKMIQHSLSSENLRTISTNLVYSYAPMELRDLNNLVLGTLNPFASIKPLNYFHEITLPVGIMLFLFFLSNHRKDLKLVLGGIFLVLLLFCLNIAPFSFLSKLFFVAPFRVEQRSLLFFSYLVPLFVISKIDWNLWLKDLLLPFSILSLMLVFPRAELIAFMILYVFCSTIYLTKAKTLMKNTVLAALLLLALINLDKVNFFTSSHHSFKNAQRLLLKAIQEFKGEKPFNEEIFYIEGPDKVFLYATAKILGMKTMEGYGSPPRSVMEKYSRYTGQRYHVAENNLYFDSHHPKFKEILKDFGISYILRME